MVESIFSFSLVIVQILSHLLLPSDLRFSVLEVLFQLNKIVRVSHLIQSFLQFGTLSHQVPDSLVSIGYFLLSCLDSYRRISARRAGHRHRISSDVGTQILPLSDSLVIHFLNQSVDIITHNFELVPESLILLLKVSLLLIHICNALNISGSILHFV